MSTFSLRHSFNNNGIERVSHLVTDPNGEIFDGDHKAPQGALYSTYDNIGKSRETGLSFYVNWNASPKRGSILTGVEITGICEVLHRICIIMGGTVPFMAEYSIRYLGKYA